MANTRRGYKATAALTRLSGDITAGATSVPVVTGGLSTWAGISSSGPFTFTIGRDTPAEETCTGTGISGDSITGVTRGANNQSHTAGATVEHTSSFSDFDEANKVVSDINAWTSLVPTIGDLGSMTATITADARNHYRYMTVGKLCFVQFNQIITPAGTRQASYSVLLPVAAAHAHDMFVCSVENLAGLAGTGDTTDRVYISRYDAATLANGASHHSFNGFYEIA